MHTYLLFPPANRQVPSAEYAMLVKYREDALLSAVVLSFILRPVQESVVHQSYQTKSNDNKSNITKLCTHLP